MDQHKKQITVTIVISALVIFYYIIYFTILISIVTSPLLRLVISIIPALLAVTMIGVCIQRINEIKGGEEDDLSQY